MEPDSTRERIAALVPGIVAAASFGVCDTVVKLVFAAGIDVLTLALIRGVVGVVILYVYLRFGATPEPATPRMRAYALVLGVPSNVVISVLNCATVMTPRAPSTVSATLPSLSRNTSAGADGMR